MYQLFKFERPPELSEREEPPRVLLAGFEDDDWAASVCEILVSQHGFSETQVLRTRTALQTLSCAMSERPSIYLINCEISGFSCSDMVTTLSPALGDSEVIVLLAQPTTAEISALAKFPIRGFLSGDCEPSEACAAIAHSKNSIDLKKDNENYRQRLIEAEKLVSLGMLAAGIVHEMNNVNTVIRGNLEILATELKDIPEKSRKRLQGALRGSERIQKTVTAIKTIAHRDVSQRKETDLPTLIEEAITLTHHRLRQHVYRTDFEPQRRNVVVNEQEILQVIMNLLVNAADAMTDKYGSQGQGELEIKVIDPKDDTHQKLLIKDTGPGIPEDIRARIFEPFFTTKPPGKGTGLGLSLSKGFVERNGGKIECESHPGEGTRFIVQLPTCYPEHG